MKEFNFLIKNVSHKELAGHIFIIYSEFHQRKSDACTLIYNDIYVPIFDKKKLVLCGWSLLYSFSKQNTGVR